MRSTDRTLFKLGLAVALLSANGVSLAEAGVNVWTSNGPAGESIQALAIDPTSPSTLYAGSSNCGTYVCHAGSATGGVFKSTDGGESWTRANAGLPTVFTLNVEALAIDPVTPSTLYAGLWWRSALGAVHSGLFKSTDGGGSWTETNWGLASGSFTFVLALAIDPLTPSTLYAGTNDGVTKSTNGGGSWTKVLSGTASRDVTSLAIDPVTPSTLYAAHAATASCTRARDGGASWSLSGAYRAVWSAPWPSTR